MTTSHRDQLNRITDAQWSWAPLLKIRPKKEEAMPVRMIFWTTVLLSSAIVVGKVGAALIFDIPVYTPRLASMFVAYSLVSYLCYSLTFARAWDERARELACRP